MLVSTTLREAVGDSMRFRYVNEASARGSQKTFNVFELLSDSNVEVDLMI